MVQNILEVLSQQELKVYALKNYEGKSIKEISVIMGCSPNTVKTYIKRIKEKIQELDKLSNIRIDMGNEILADVIVDIFNEEVSKTSSKLTVKQVQFLSQCSQMSLKGPDTSAEREMRRRTGLNKKVSKRAMTEEEIQNFKSRPATLPRPDRNVSLAYMEYQRKFNNTTNIEEMASLEIILRSAGVLYRTPYINKLNRKTMQQLRAQESGYESVIVAPWENDLIPQGAKHIESVKNSEGHVEYSIWLFPRNAVNKKSKRKEVI